MMTLFKHKIRTPFLVCIGVAMLIMTGCQKGTFDINDPNPNKPSTVPPKYSLSAALAGTASLMLGGDCDMFNNWMGYWSQSGDYTPSPTFVYYQINTDTYSDNWDGAYLNLVNYKVIIDQAAKDSSLGNYQAVAMIMKAFVYQRIIDIYNNAPYDEALSSKNFTPGYSDAQAIYKSLVNQIDSAITIINNPDPNAESLDQYDAMFAGDMDKWKRFGNTLKLKILLRQTETSGGPGYIQSELGGYTPADFLGADENASVNPGYSLAADNQRSPLYADIGYTAAGAQAGNNIYFRANSYAVSFFNNANDTFRLRAIYEVKSDGNVYGKAYGSNLLGEHNTNISGVNGNGVVVSGTQDAVILPAFESLFLLAEAQERGYISGGSAAASYQAAVEESFKLLGIADAVNTADTYIGQTGSLTNTVNYLLSTDKLQTIILQKWAACNPFDGLESYSDWRRLRIPKDLPVSVYQGNTTTHIPYRLEYPTSEHSYNAANVGKQGNIDVMSSKIFWMP
jgi:hypothetical protein